MAQWIPFWKLLGFALYLALYFGVCQPLGDYPAENFTTVTFKLLPMMHLVFILITTDFPEEQGFGEYKWNIMLGLMFSMAGDACLVWRIKLFLPGLLFFTCAHVFYIRAFGLEPIGSLPTLVSCLIIGGLGFLLIAPGITEGPVMLALVLGYNGIIFLMFWRSLVSYQIWTSRATFFACAGAICFCLSDFMIAYDKWREVITQAPSYVMVTYFLAQLLITLSAACFEEKSNLKED